MGVTTRKKIIPKTTGEIIFPKNIPNLNQTLFKGAKNLEFNKPKTRKIREIINDHTLILWPFINGYKQISKKTIKKTKPKLLFDGSFIFSVSFMVYLKFKLKISLVYIPFWDN